MIDKADFIACHNQSYVNQYDLLKGLKKGGNFVLNTIWNQEDIERKLPAKMKRYIAENEINFYTVNATKIATEIGLGRRINMIMQSAFFKLAEIIPQEEGLLGAYKQCEIAGRTAYKSLDKITNDSAKRFVEAMCKSNHGAVLEHGTIYLHFSYC